MSNKFEATFHGIEHDCTDCGTTWPAKAAADECALLEQIEARNARRPTRTGSSSTRAYDDED